MRIRRILWFGVLALWLTSCGLADEELSKGGEEGASNQSCDGAECDEEDGDGLQTSVDLDWWRDGFHSRIDDRDDDDSEESSDADGESSTEEDSAPISDEGDESPPPEEEPVQEEEPDDADPSEPEDRSGNDDSGWNGANGDDAQDSDSSDDSADSDDGDDDQGWDGGFDDSTDTATGDDTDYDLQCADDSSICRFCGPVENLVMECPAGDSSFECQVFELINEIRVDEGLDALDYNGTLAEAAMIHAMDMSLCDYFAHDSLDGTDFFERCYDTVYSGTCTGENIGGGQQSPQAVVDAWMDSPGHRQNILYPHHSELGIAFFEGDGFYTRYWVKNFGRD